jgi:heme-degrading monooxygenase HmoA
MVEPGYELRSRSTKGRHSMNCTRIAFYDITAGSYDEVVDQAKTGMVPLFEHSPGFVSYAVAQIDKTAFVSLSTWHTREQADAATTTAAGWVTANATGHFALRENYIGDLAIDIDARHHAELAH